MIMSFYQVFLQKIHLPTLFLYHSVFTIKDSNNEIYYFYGTYSTIFAWTSMIKSHLRSTCDFKILPSSLPKPRVSQPTPEQRNSHNSEPASSSEPPKVPPRSPFYSDNFGKVNEDEGYSKVYKQIAI